MEWQSCAHVAKHTLVFQFYAVKHCNKSMNFTCLLSLWYISQTGQHNTFSTSVFTLFPSVVIFLYHTQGGTNCTLEQLTCHLQPEFSEAHKVWSHLL